MLYALIQALHMLWHTPEQAMIIALFYMRKTCMNRQRSSGGSENAVRQAKVLLPVLYKKGKALTETRSEKPGTSLMSFLNKLRSLSSVFSKRGMLKWPAGFSAETEISVPGLLCCVTRVMAGEAVCCKLW